MREHGMAFAERSSSARPMRKRRPLSASRLMPRTTMLRRTSSPETRSRPRWLAIAARLSASISVSWRAPPALP